VDSSTRGPPARQLTGGMSKNGRKGLYPGVPGGGASSNPVRDAADNSQGRPDGSKTTTDPCGGKTHTNRQVPSRA